jgi:NAD(P) transhydrogenase subunit alpha
MNALLLAPLLGNAVAAEDPAARFIRLLTVFLLAMWVGFEVITKVPQRLHTPLTSGSNAISGITAVGAIVVAGAMATSFGTIFGFLALVLAMINVVGGFVVTHRMLAMFNPKKK